MKKFKAMSITIKDDECNTIRFRKMKIPKVTWDNN